MRVVCVCALLLLQGVSWLQLHSGDGCAAETPIRISLRSSRRRRRRWSISN